MFNYVHFTHMYICKALCQHMRTSLLLLCPIWFESAIFKLIAYPRSKVKEVKELLFGVTFDWSNWDWWESATFSISFTISHFSIRQKLHQSLGGQCPRNGDKNAWQIIGQFDILHTIFFRDWVSQLKLIAHEDLHFAWQYCGLIRIWSAVGFSSKTKWMPRFLSSHKMPRFFLPMPRFDPFVFFRNNLLLISDSDSPQCISPRFQMLNLQRETSTINLQF